jgi:hypothetical protein
MMRSAFRIWICLLLLALASMAAAADVKTLDLPSNDLVYSFATDRIYASVPSTAGRDLGNRIAAIDPATGAIAHSVLVGSEPGPLALAEGGEALYVGLTGSAEILRLELPELRESLRFALGLETGVIVASDIAVDPVDSGTIAVLLSLGPRGFFDSALAIYSGGVRQGPLVPDRDVRHIEYGASGETLYGIDRDGNLVTYAVTADGVQRSSQIRQLFRAGADVRFVPPQVLDSGQISPGRLFGSDGVVVEPTAPRLLGTFRVEASAFDASPELADFVVERIGSDPKIQTFDPATFLQLSEVVVPVQGEPKGLLRTADDAFALRTDRQLVLTRGMDWLSPRAQALFELRRVRRSAARVKR